MTQDTDAARRIAHEQALASTRLEGHEPTPEFLADAEAVLAGTMTPAQARAASLARALAAERAADGTGGAGELTGGDAA